MLFPGPYYARFTSLTTFFCQTSSNFFKVSTLEFFSLQFSNLMGCTSWPQLTFLFVAKPQEKSPKKVFLQLGCFGEGTAAMSALVLCNKKIKHKSRTKGCQIKSCESAINHVALKSFYQRKALQKVRRIYIYTYIHLLE